MSKGPGKLKKATRSLGAKPVAARKKAEEAWERSQAELRAIHEHAPATMRGTVQDITQRRRLVDALHHSVSSLAEAQTLSRIGSWRVVFRDGAESWSASDELRRMWSFPAGFPISMPAILERFHPDDRAKTQEIWAAALGSGGPTEWEHRIVVEGRVKWMQVRIQMRRDDQGRLAEVAGTSQDITERKMAEQALRQSEQKFRRLYESICDAFIITDMSGLIQDFNPAFQQMIGYSAEELRKLTYLDITPERWHAMQAPIMRDQLMVRGYTDVYEKEYRRKDGTVFPVELRAYLVRDDAGRPVGMWGIARDLTERQRAAEQAANQQAAIAHLSRVVTMGELAAGIAHDVNQPLGASLLYAETCLDLLKTGVMEAEEMAVALRALIDQLERARITVTRLRKFMRKQRLSYTALDASQVVMDAAELLAHEIKKAGVSLIFELAPRPPLVVADAVLVQQVIINLIMNALEAMAAPGDRPRRLTLGTAAGVDGSCTVTVGDTGPGVPPALAERLFDSFVTGKPQGMGLGLAISRSLIEQHEGRIWHEAGEAGGALFKFTLPAAPPGKKGALP